MSLSRWKMMAGVLGVSIGGLAAAASQCPKFDKSKGRQPEAPVVTAEAPKVPPAGAPSAPATPPALPAVPTAPQMTPAGVTPPPALPAIPDFTAPPKPSEMKPSDVKPASAALPALPGIPEAPATPAVAPPAPKPDMIPPAPSKVAPVVEAPKAAPTGDLIPPAPSKPTPPATAPSAPPAPIDFPALPGTSAVAPPSGKPTATPPVVGASGTAQPPVAPPSGTLPPPSSTPSVPPSATPPALPLGQPEELTVPPSKPATPTPAPAPAANATKFRILLRVGEGEPTFEVKNGDDLVLKVACEKVDIKSPEKGAGLSSVTARGKVRFAGFGVEGTCDELSFMAGTGEVSMSGEVKVQMKDKLGRVESELTTATLKYKIDGSIVGNAIKP